MLLQHPAATKEMSFESYHKSPLYCSPGRKMVVVGRKYVYRFVVIPN